MAQLYYAKRVEAHLVRLRQQESGEALPGVSMGECPAPPAAPPTAALGWLRLSGVRVPRAHPSAPCSCGPCGLARADLSFAGVIRFGDARSVR